ncbi:MAG TPA: carboxypeptidase-like regulatory domain-containing protein [Candidatus Baltobacteraceae bacterium]|jgi:hypothetical protein|nr:carboxypeptidase-like regulatory domain-containing protein [Candidatus Baltobacteraceae bacterium]
MLSIVLAGLIFSPFANQSGAATFASVRGVVTTGWPSYKPVANAQVVVSGDVDLRMTRTDANGRYTFLTLLPGVYRVYVPSVKGIVMANGPRQSSDRFRKCYDEANAPVELSAGLAYFANIDLVTHCG